MNYITLMALWDLKGHHVTKETCFKVYSKPAQSNSQHDNLFKWSIWYDVPSMSWS